MISEDKPIYMSYLLRLWEDDDRESGRGTGSAPVWRASLENAFTHELQGFETLNDLFEFLENQMASASQARDAERKPFTDSPTVPQGGTS